jgi:ppGpp synthetase/RelA/SpoT-type nucleotidyltranferase
METSLPVMNEGNIRNITENIITILLKKNEDYGSASFDLGLNGNMVHLWDKVKRYKTLVEKRCQENTSPNFESIKDTLEDILGYGIIGLIILEQEKIANKL